MSQSTFERGIKCNMNNNNVSTQVPTKMTGEDLSDSSSPDSSFEMIGNTIGGENMDVEISGKIGHGDACMIEQQGFFFPLARKKKRPHVFETNPSTRKRQQCRLLGKLKSTLDEYTAKVGQQAVVLCFGSKKSGTSNFKCFGSKPLETVIREPPLSDVISQGLNKELLTHRDPKIKNDNCTELPRLLLDDKPTSVEKMTQAQLRTFIPEMLKFSEGRSKPGWGKREYQPPWWPKDCPWANVRSDVRSEEQKKLVSWTDTLRSIVTSCYLYHEREDLLNASQATQTKLELTDPNHQQLIIQSVRNSNDAMSMVQMDSSSGQFYTLPHGTVLNASIFTSMPNFPQQESVHAIDSLASSENKDDFATYQNGQCSESTEASGIGTLAECGQILFTDSDGSVMSIQALPVSLYQQLSSSSIFSEIHSSGNEQVSLSPTSLERGVVTSKGDNVK